MQYQDLRDFIKQLEATGQLQRIRHPVDPNLEMTEICDRTLRAGGPALLFENPVGSDIPVLANLFGTHTAGGRRHGRRLCRSIARNRQATGIFERTGATERHEGRLGETACVQKSYGHGAQGTEKRTLPAAYYSKLMKLTWAVCRFRPAGQVTPAPLITWALVVTRGPHKERQNLGIYRQQVLSRNKVIMRWLAHRGGALDYRDWQQEHPGEPFPVAVALGADPATILGAVTPVPDTLSEYAFAGLLRGSKTELVKCKTIDLQVPASAEFVLEGHIHPGEEALEGPFGDHTGYYNEQENFPVFTIDCITHRDKPDLPQHLYRPSPGRTSRSRPGAQ